jgi:1-acyl-sn-glycerol-3-phosphate acyltransferase
LDVGETIPLRRGEPDIGALRTAIERLKAGRMIIIDPEGTRSGDGHLQKGNPGAVLLALRSGAPILPVVFHGSEHYKENLRRLRRTDFKIEVGKPFYLDAGGRRVTSQVRQQMIDEVMYQMAALLPPAYRGVYSDMDAATEEYLVWLPG